MTTTTMTMTTPEPAVPDSKPPPELALYVANGYNARDGNFLGAPVFTLTYAKGNTVPWNADERAIPDQISADAATSAYDVDQALLMETQADYDRSYSASVGAEYAGVTYSGSVSSSFLWHGSLFSSTSTTYALNYHIQSVLSFERLPFAGSVPGNVFEGDFLQALGQLPETIDTADAQQQYIETRPTASCWRPCARPGMATSP